MRNEQVTFQSTVLDNTQIAIEAGSVTAIENRGGKMEGEDRRGEMEMTVRDERGVEKGDERTEMRKGRN